MSGSKNEPPRELLCPLTLELIVDAVMDPEGNSFSKAAIEAWLDREQTSPITRAPMHKEQLVVNRALRDAAERWKAENNWKPKPASDDKKKIEASAVAVTQPKISINGGAEGRVLVTVAPPPLPRNMQRFPAHLVCVIDISGSMAAAAVLKTKEGAIDESDGLCQLDIVKHAIKTLAHCLGDADSLSLVVYNGNASVVFRNKRMTAVGKAEAVEALKTFCPLGQTNLWDGLVAGLDLLRAGADKSHNSSVLLFTDGMPNIIPPRGHTKMLERYSQRYGLPGAVHTFGFGYSLDSQMLSELALVGGGQYAFIPDASLTGTVFVNALSIILSQCYVNITVSVGSQLTEQAQSASVLPGGHRADKDLQTGETLLHLGSMSFGQAKSFIINTATAPDSVAQCLAIRYFPLGDTTGVGIVCPQEALVQCCVKEAVTAHALRLLAVDTLRAAVDLGRVCDFGKAAAGIRKVLDVIKQTPSHSILPQHMPRVNGLSEDLRGEVLKALGKAEFQKWGVHYLPSLLGAHLHEICNNFKDPGVQEYGGDLFRSIRDAADDVFVSLPPPVVHHPQSTPKVHQSGVHGRTAPAPKYDMSRYYNRCGGCFLGSCFVTMADGTQKQAADVKQGDTVLSDGGPAEVLCVVRIAPDNGCLPMTVFPATGLVVTPYHPIRTPAGDWVFPCEVPGGTTTTVTTPYVYDYVLASGHTVTVQGIACVTLGHGFTLPVVVHPFFGSSNCRRCLEGLDGWQEGITTLTPHNFIRDSAGQVTAITV